MKQKQLQIIGDSITENNTMDLTLKNVITQALKIPGIKVNKTSFLANQFKDKEAAFLETILEKGSIEAGLTRDELYRMAEKIVWERTMVSSAGSFVTGIPGGLAMVATVPTDLLQYYSVALRMAQEIMYLYGAKDLWDEGISDDESIMNQLMLYCGVMFGVSSASSAVRVMSSVLAKQVAKKLPQKALTKTFYYPIAKSVAQFFGAKMTKTIFAEMASKAIPIVGGLLSGGITLVSMRSMGLRLVNTLDQALFNYTEEMLQNDIDVVMGPPDTDSDRADNEEGNIGAVWEKASEKARIVSDKTKNSIIHGLATIKKKTKKETSSLSNDVLMQIAQAKEMLDEGIIDEEEYRQIKSLIIGHGE